MADRRFVPVLLKGMDGRGFVFFTNYASRKAREIEQTGRASLLFLWRTVAVCRVKSTEPSRRPVTTNRTCISPRPLESRWSVYASRQSDPVESRQALDSRYEVARQIYGETVHGRTGGAATA